MIRREFINYPLSRVDDTTRIVRQTIESLVIDSREVIALTIVNNYADEKFEEELAGVDGVRTCFATTHRFVAGSMELWLNGIRIRKGPDYYENAQVGIVFTEYVPSIVDFTDVITARYIIDK